jgi:uncharacterized protein YegJ (DUF2314 family)
MNATRSSLFALLCLPLLACSSGEQEPPASREADSRASPVSQVPADDDDMNRAMERARGTLDEYRRRLTNPPATHTDLSLKARFEADGHIEHMWIDAVEITTGGFRGKLGNDPVHIDTMKLGDPVEIRAGQVSDWMAIDDGRLVGGYTVRVLRERMSADERAAFDAQMEFTVD